jgi:hypothetical protein
MSFFHICVKNPYLYLTEIDKVYNFFFPTSLKTLQHVVAFKLHCYISVNIISIFYVLGKIICNYKFIAQHV